MTVSDLDIFASGAPASRAVWRPGGRESTPSKPYTGVPTSPDGGRSIRILRPGIELPKIVPKRIEFRPRYFKRGQLPD
jgi:hypothetical protein